MNKIFRWKTYKYTNHTTIHHNESKRGLWFRLLYLNLQPYTPSYTSNDELRYFYLNIRVNINYIPQDTSLLVTLPTNHRFCERNIQSSVATLYSQPSYTYCLVKLNLNCLMRYH